MRFWWLLLAALAAAWLADDYEIFELNTNVRRDLGPDTTFYLWLGLPGPAASYDEILKAYRRLLRKIHPDKVRIKAAGDAKKKKKAQQRFARLLAVSAVLRDGARKERYDYFLSKGFPRYTRSGYLYSKVRPGAVMVVVGVYLALLAVHYLAMLATRRLDRGRVQALIDEVKRAAWPAGIPPPGGERLVTKGGEQSFLVRADGTVFLLDPEDSSRRFRLAPEAIENVGVRETALFRLPVGVWNLTLGRLGLRIPVPNAQARGEGLVEEEAQVVELVEEVEEEVEDRRSAKKKTAALGSGRRLPNGKIVGRR